MKSSEAPLITSGTSWNPGATLTTNAVHAHLQLDDPTHVAIHRIAEFGQQVEAPQAWAASFPVSEIELCPHLAGIEDLPVPFAAI